MAKTQWDIERPEPYTAAGLRRKKCIRCGKPATTQWQICSDGNNYRPLCFRCDIKLNRLVLDFAMDPASEYKICKYMTRHEDKKAAAYNRSIDPHYDEKLGNPVYEMAAFSAQITLQRMERERKLKGKPKLTPKEIKDFLTRRGVN